VRRAENASFAQTPAAKAQNRSGLPSMGCHGLPPDLPSAASAEAPTACSSVRAQDMKRACYSYMTAGDERTSEHRAFTCP
jgi:hypothetical protein